MTKYLQSLVSPNLVDDITVPCFFFFLFFSADCCVFVFVFVFFNLKVAPFDALLYPGAY